MAGLLDNLSGNLNDPNTMGLLQLAAAIGAASGPSVGRPNNLSAGILSGLGAYQGVQNEALKRKLSEAEIANFAAQAEERKQNAAKLQLAIDQLRAKQEYLMRQATPQLPSNATIMRPDTMVPQRRPFNPAEAMLANLSPEEIKMMAQGSNLGRPKVTHYENQMGQDGKLYKVGLDEYGNVVETNVQPWQKSEMVNVGSHQIAVNPVDMSPRATFQMNATPGEVMSNQLGQSRLNFDISNANKPQVVTVPGVGVYTVDRNTGTGAPVTSGGAPIQVAPSADQSTSATYAVRADEANKAIEAVGNNYSPAAIALKQGSEGALFGLGTPLSNATNYFMSPNSQMAEQAQRNFINAVLRRESGAVINPSEFANARKQYFPQVGDSEEVKAQKRRNRQEAIAGLRVGAGPALGRVQSTLKDIQSESDPLGIRK